MVAAALKFSLIAPVWDVFSSPSHWQIEGPHVHKWFQNLGWPLLSNYTGLRVPRPLLVLICTCTLDKTHGQGCNYMLDVCQWNTVLKVKFLWQVYFLFIVKVMSTILSRFSRSTWAMIMDTVIESRLVQVKCWPSVHVCHKTLKTISLKGST